MAKRKHLPVLIAGKRYEGWMPFADDEPVLVRSVDYYYQPPAAEVYATREDASATAEDVRHVTILVTTTRRKKVTR